jgi:hypothetical protein
MNRQFFFIAGVCLLAYLAVEVSAQYGFGFPGGFPGIGGGNAEERLKYRRNVLAYQVALRDWQRKASRTIVLRNALNDLARASTFTKWSALGMSYYFLFFPPIILHIQWIMIIYNITSNQNQIFSRMDYYLSANTVIIKIQYIIICARFALDLLFCRY